MVRPKAWMVPLAMKVYAARERVDRDEGKVDAQQGLKKPTYHSLVAEYIVGDLFGISPDTSTDIKPYDLLYKGAKIDVKLTGNGNINVVKWKEKNPCDVYVALRKKDNWRYEILGWQWGLYVFLGENLKNGYRGQFYTTDILFDFSILKIVLDKRFLLWYNSFYDEQ